MPSREDGVQRSIKRALVDYIREELVRGLESGAVSDEEVARTISVLERVGVMDA